MVKKTLVQEQLHICWKYNANYVECSLYQKLGISLNVKEKTIPLNGLRLKPEGDTTGCTFGAVKSFWKIRISSNNFAGKYKEVT